MYADTMTDSMRFAIDETKRRRAIQEAYNTEHGIVPKTIVKRVDEVIRGKETKEMAAKYMSRKKKFSKKDKEALVEDLRKQMKEAAAVLDFERAAELRDMIAEIQTSD